MATSTRSTNPAFKGPFLFVNHDAANMKALPHRPAVFHHVRNGYRKWRRCEDTRLLRASAQVPTTCVQDSSTRLKEFTSDFETPAGDQANEEQYTESSSPPLTAVKAEDNTLSKEIPLHYAPRHEEWSSISPSTILGKGNSDPFDSFSIPIDPQVGRVMTFYRDCVIPSTYHTYSRCWVASDAAMRDWNACVDSLQDEASTYGFLARYAAVASSICRTSAFDRQGFLYKSRTTAIVRSRLTEGFDPNSGPVFWPINMLFSSDVIARNRAGAIVHCNVLRYLFEIQKMQGNVDMKMLTCVLFHDIQLAATLLTRPILDTEKWIPETFGPSWEAAADLLPPLPEISSKFLDPSVDSEKLRTVFNQQRESYELWIRGASKQKAWQPLIMYWLTSRDLMDQGFLINHFLDLSESYHTRSKSAADCLHAQAYISLAALYWARVAGPISPTICGIQLYDAGPTILTELRTALIQDGAPLGHKDLSKYRNARLWALYVGAYAEWTTETKQIDPAKGWFNSTFASQARSMSLLSWQAVREVLEGFLYGDNMQPHGSQWFSKTMNAHPD